jgi:hypothetical protein
LKFFKIKDKDGAFRKQDLEKNFEFFAQKVLNSHIQKTLFLLSSKLCWPFKIGGKNFLQI